MTNTINSHQNLNVKNITSLFEEVQNRYINKLISIDEKKITTNERNKYNHDDENRQNNDTDRSTHTDRYNDTR
ncbi:unnamed protein product, partial [Rotaria sordida]